MQMAAAPIYMDSVKGCNFMAIQSTSAKLSLIIETLYSTTFLTSKVTS